MLRILNAGAACLVLSIGITALCRADTTTEAQRQAELARVDAMMAQKSFKDKTAAQRQEGLSGADAMLVQKSFKDELKDQRQTMENQSFDPNGTGFNLPKKFYSDGQKFAAQSLGDNPSFVAEMKAQKNDYPIAFVSFSLPKQTLQKIINDMHRVGGAIIFRGLVDNDFQKTTQAIKDLQNENANALIDPTMFKRFKVQAVPTFVVPLEPITVCTQSDEEAQKFPCPIPKNFRASGDVSFSYLLDLVERTGSSEEKAVAQKLDIALRGDK